MTRPVTVTLLMVATALVASAGLPALASVTQEGTNHVVAYQFDANTYHDAPDTCAEASSAYAFDAGQQTDAMLVPGDDPADAIEVNITAAMVGARVSVTLSEEIGSLDADLAFYAPNCDGDMFAAQNLPKPLPMPPLPLSTEIQLPAASLTNATWPCNQYAWVYELTNTGGSAPASIYAVWTDGSRATLNLSYQSATRGYYGTTSNLGYLPKDAWVNVPSGSTSQFTLLTGPCNALDGKAVFGLPPMAGDDFVRFTPVRAGAYVIYATIAKPTAPGTSLMVPATCHYCFGPVTGQTAMLVSYHLRADAS